MISIASSCTWMRSRIAKPTVIRMRFGLESYKPMTLREVGENLGLTRERVRQLESQALQKLMNALAETGGRIGNLSAANDA